MHYMGYEPIKDASGKVIGAYSVGVERFTGPLLCARQPPLGVALVRRAVASPPAMAFSDTVTWTPPSSNLPLRASRT